MRIYFILSLLCLSFSSCNTKKFKEKNEKPLQTDYTIAFGSCNKQSKKNILWSAVEKNNPNLWIWGGDNIYSDTENMDKMKQDYNTLLQQEGYKTLLQNTPILATWDDHDYGVNDGGKEFPKKKQTQQLFLDFLGVAKDSPRRNREGIYHSELITTPKGSIKVILLDTRYFRTALSKAKEKRRYVANPYGEGTILGKQQWLWLQNELKTSTADFNIIVSSIQILSSEHGFETWGNFPHEAAKLKKLIITSRAKGILLLSGDRHISEFSQTNVEGLPYLLTDFTSSGLTHSYTSYKGEPNALRKQEVIHEISFGLLQFDFDQKTIQLEMRGKNNVLLQEMKQTY